MVQPSNKRIVTYDVFDAFTATTRQLVTNTDLPSTGVHVAHRAGGGGYPTFAPQLAPDGALSAARVSTALGYHIIDGDFQVTQDGVAVMMHDTTFDRTTNGTGLVSSLPFNLMPQVDMRYACGNGWGTEVVPTVEEWISEFGGRVMLTIEAKDGASSVPLLEDIIKSYGLEKSVFVNCIIGDTGGMAAVIAAGLLLHVYGGTSTTHVTTADTNGAWLMELPFNATTALTAALAATNIKRVVAAPIFKRVDRDAMTAGFHGYVSNSIGYLDMTPDRRDIIGEIVQQRVAPGWYSTTEWTRTTFPMFSDVSRNVILSTENGSRRDLLLGAMCSTKPAAYSIDLSMVFGAWTTDTNCRFLGRAACTSDEGTSLDADSRGYPFAIRKSGQMILWNAPVGYGAASALATIQTPAVPDTGATLRCRLDVTATTVALTRIDTSIILSSSVTAGTVTSLPVVALTTAVASATSLRLPNGQYAAASATAAIGATSITVTSFTLNQTIATASPIYYSTGAIADTTWRGNYLWIGGSLSGSINHMMELPAYFWGVPNAYLSAAVTAGAITTLTVYPLAAAINSGTVLRLPDGTLMTVASTAAINATSITVTSVTVPAMKIGDVIYAA